MSQTVIYEIRMRSGAGFFTIDHQVAPYISSGGYVSALNSDFWIAVQQVRDGRPHWRQLQEAARALKAKEEPFKQRIRIRTAAIDYILEHVL